MPASVKCKLKLEPQLQRLPAYHAVLRPFFPRMLQPPGAPPPHPPRDLCQLAAQPPRQQAQRLQRQPDYFGLPPGLALQRRCCHAHLPQLVQHLGHWQEAPRSRGPLLPPRGALRRRHGCCRNNLLRRRDRCRQLLRAHQGPRPHRPDRPPPAGPSPPAARPAAGQPACGTARAPPARPANRAVAASAFQRTRQQVDVRLSIMQNSVPCWALANRVDLHC